MLSLALMTLRRGRRALALLASFCLLGSARAAPTEVAGTMPEDYLPQLKTILAAASRQAPQVIVSEIGIAQREAQVYVADSARLPSFGGHIDYLSNQTAISSNSSTQTRDSGAFGSLALNQPIFHWGALKNESDKARIGVLFAEKSYTEAIRTLVVNLRQQYLMLIARKAYLRQARFALKLAKTELDLATDKLANGATSPAEVEGRKLIYEDAGLQVDRSDAEFAGMRRALARMAGLGDLAEEAIPAEIPQPVYPAETAAGLLEGLRRDGAKSTFAAEAAALHIREADLNYRIANVRLLPKFGASAAYSQQNTTNASPTSVTQTGISQLTVGVTGQWNIFDGFATRGVKLAARSERRLHEQELQSATEAALDQAQKLARDLELDARAMALNETRRAQAEAGVKYATDEFGLGNQPQSAIDRATFNLHVSEFNNANARAMFLWHWSEFVSLAGSDPALTQLPAHYAREKR
jgi:outer membrane protein TolC